MRKKKLWFAILVSALGYFVDVYDIILFSAVRVPSLRDLGFIDTEITSYGILLINIQLIGMLFGSITWGILGDKKGRLSILFGSIILYSSATFLNAFVTNIETYAILRFLAGFGLAGELGAGITLVNELMPKEQRGYGSMLIASAGALGGFTGGMIGDVFSWKTAYIVGGLAGFALLFLRIGLIESSLFSQIKSKSHIQRGNPFLFLKSLPLLKKYLTCLLIGLPFWVFVGIFMALAPEMGRALEVNKPITAGLAISMFCFGLTFGNISSGLVSQLFSSRKKALTVYLSTTLAIVIGFLFTQNMTSQLFYFFCCLMGLSSGSWVVFIMISAEQFGTNIRATAAITLPNMVRIMVIPCAAMIALIKPYTGIVWGVGFISIISIIMALVAVSFLQESFSTDLDFVEH
ncbi:MAG: MFS transporter [Gammaproteobacteria bacterium]